MSEPPTTTATPAPLPCRRVILVRHGHYDRVGDAGDAQWRLSALGRRQAVRVGRRLERMLSASAARFEGVYASPWPRATETAEIAAREMSLLNLKVKPYLHELLPVVDPERMALAMFPVGLPATPTEGRQQVHEQIERVRARFFKPPRKSSMVLVFTHGNLIRYLVARCLGLPYEAWAVMDIAHGSVTEIRVFENGFEALISYNETGHFPPTMVTTA